MKLAERIFKRNDYYITSPFGNRIDPINGNRSFHSGCDYGTHNEKWAQYGVEDGVVLSCGIDYKYDNAKYVWVKYPRLNIKLLYYHLDSISVVSGQNVDNNTIIGYTGKTGRATGIHLHLGMKYLGNDNYVNPEKYDYKENINYTGVITYQAYIGKWLGQITKVDNTDYGYAGIYGKAISGFKCKPQYGELIYQAHVKGGDWLSKINSNDFDKGGDYSFAGIYGKPIDCIKIKSTKGHVTYRVHVKGGNWLSWIDSRIETGTESYAGIYGKEIDGIQMY